MRKPALFFLISFYTLQINAQEIPLAKPSPVQYEWQEQERILFIHFGVATWLGMEYDESGAFDLKRMNPAQLNTDAWCETARSWGAKQVIFVAKHVGGFCWWPTNTTDYCVRKIPWKNGKGDLLREVAASCKKYGLKMGIYIYPGDVKYGAGIGSGGKTSDPSLQKEYDKVFRQQLTEVLSRYGNMMEVWFDGNCVIDVSDILKRYASHSVIFQSTHASIRWPGTESGRLAYPAWNSLSGAKLRTGLSTQYDDDPNGDAWAPLESDAPFYNHNWFWSPTNTARRKTLDELIDIYYKSVGYGGTMLLNASPDTTGQIQPDDRKLYEAFGKEINRRFGQPLKSLTHQKGKQFTLSFPKPVAINHIITEEDYRQGHRIREYELEGKINGEWKPLAKGSSVGRKKIDAFSTVTVAAVRLTITKHVNQPLLRSLSVYEVKDFQPSAASMATAEWKECGNWDTKTFKKGKDTITVTLSPFITTPGQYEIVLKSDVSVTGTYIDSAVINFENQNTLQEYLVRKDHSTFYINRTSQISKNSSSTLTFYMHSDNEVFQNRGRFFIRARK